MAAMAEPLAMGERVGVVRRPADDPTNVPTSVAQEPTQETVLDTSTDHPTTKAPVLAPAPEVGESANGLNSGLYSHIWTAAGSGPDSGSNAGLNTGLNAGSNTESNAATPLSVLCGPLLNYCSMSDAQTATPRWHGSVLLVTKPADRAPKLRLRPLGPDQTRGRNDGETYTSTDDDDGASTRPQTVTGYKLYSDPLRAFWRMDLNVPLQSSEASWEYTIEGVQFESGDAKPSRSTRTFWVPSKHESMRIMFHSCNGFSVGADVDLWSGPALWNDVLRVHAEKPFHVMIGGGDQIYNDGVRVTGPLKAWTSINNPHKRREHPFPETMRADCDAFYYNNYQRWYTTEPFATANGQIPQINIWDDHDIIDGYGSYADRFMRCAVFRGIGAVARKYYLLFQHHCAPSASTFTTDAPPPTTTTTDAAGVTGAGPDAVQGKKDVFVLPDQDLGDEWVLGAGPGPYMTERSRSYLGRLGKKIAFLGVDARTERTRQQINYPGTLDIIFRRVDAELRAARGDIKHLIVLLGVPIAYPRLIWLENILRLPIIGPIRFLHKHFGVAQGFFNSFDGTVDLLDDLDDHYTARQHKAERKDLILRLQQVSRQHSVRVTILSGDVHLAALGRFYSKPALGVATVQDHRYMVNVVSSAITNQPPPKGVANMLARRNRIHHLDPDTDETLLDMFDRAPGHKAKAAANNHCTMPSRNYAILTETMGTDSTGATTTATNGTSTPGADTGAMGAATTTTTTPSSTDKHAGHRPLHAGEEDAGTKHPAASGALTKRRQVPGPDGLDVSIRVEIDRADAQGHTEGYGVHSKFFYLFFSFFFFPISPSLF